MAIIDVTSFDPSTGSTTKQMPISNPLPGQEGTWLIYNDSGTTIKMIWDQGNKTKRIMAGTIDIITICNPDNIINWVIDNALSNASSWPASLVLIDGYSTDEKLPYAAFPVPLNRANNIGNQIVVSSTSSINVFNVKSYGAVGDGVTDDSTAIQAALNAAIAAPNSSVYFPAVGDTAGYLINTGMVCASQYIRFMGDGWGSRIIAGPSLTGDMLQVTAPVSGFRYGIVIEDLFFDGNSVSGINAIHLISTYGAEVMHNRIRNVSGRAIYLDGVSGQFGAYNVILDNHITDVAGTTGTGIETNDSEWAKIIGNHFAFYSGGTLPGSPVIAVKLNNLNCLVEGNSFDHCDIGVNQRFAGKTTIIGNQFDRGYQSFIWLQGAIDTTIIGNVFCSYGTGAVPNASTAIIRASDSSNAGNVAIGNTCTASTWPTFILESSGIGSTVPNQYLANDDRSYTSTLRGGIMDSLGTTNLEMIGHGIDGVSGNNGVITAATALLTGGAATFMRHNAYSDGSNPRYLTSAAACDFSFLAPPSGAPALSPYYAPAPSGTAGNVITYDQARFIAGVSFFGGSSAGTYTHGLGFTPQLVFLTDNTASSTMTVGADSYGATTVHINQGAAHTWLAAAIGY